MYAPDTSRKLISNILWSGVAGIMDMSNFIYSQSNLRTKTLVKDVVWFELSEKRNDEKDRGRRDQSPILFSLSSGYWWSSDPGRVCRLQELWLKREHKTVPLAGLGWAAGSAAFLRPLSLVPYYQVLQVLSRYLM